MTIHRHLFAGIVALCLSCTARAKSPHPPPPSAEIGSTLARFVFPTEVETISVGSRHEFGAPVARGYEWSVRWYPVAPSRGPLEIAVRFEDRTEVQPDPQRARFRDAIIQVREVYLRGEPAAVGIIRDTVLLGPAITVQTVRGAVVLTVNGAAAIARLFPQIPDSVELAFPGKIGYDDVDVVVRKRR